MDKIALIISGGIGMGADISKKTAIDCFKIGILSSSGKGEELAGQLGGIGVTGSNLSSDDLSELFNLTKDKWGRVDALINSAGHRPKGEISSLITWLCSDATTYITSQNIRIDGGLTRSV